MCVTPYRVIHGASLDQLLCWWDDLDLVPTGFTREEAIDEIAGTLATQGDDGITALKRHLDSDDAYRRKAALYVLAFPNTADTEIRSALIRAFASADDSVKYAALWGFIHLDYFPLSNEQLTQCLEASNERLAALSMVYLSRARPDVAAVVLRDGLRSPNPRKREYACDEIGDREIRVLVTDMRVLLDDADPDVVKAAECNLEFFD
jgi:hypothetical protein